MGSAAVQEDERIETLRAMIDTMLSETQMYGKIRSAISATGDSKSTLAKLLSTTTKRNSLSQEEDVLALRVEVLGGSCFVGEAVDAASKGNAHLLRAHFCFGRQRAESNPADATVEPSLRGSFMFRVAKPRPRTEGEWHELLTRSGVSTLRICVTRERSSLKAGYSSRHHQRELVATGCIDWRQALINAGGETAVELKACGPDSVLSEQSNAVLRLSTEVVALGHNSTSGGESDHADSLETPFDEETTRREMRRSASRRAETSRTFYLYAKDWWNRFTSSSSSSSKGVRIFSRDETGDLRCVCSTVSPLRAPRGLDSPRHCARFVSLIPLEKSHSSSMGAGGGADDAWHTPHAFLSRRAGDVWDHATLLCSLLLGFGLEAYVALGEIKTFEGKTQPHAWVVSVSSEDKTITAWESATGRRSSLVPLDADANSKYATIACVFDHEKLFANTQKTEMLAEGLSMNFEDSNKWMMLDAKGNGGGGGGRDDDNNNAAFVSPAADFALLGNALDVAGTESALESELMALIQDRRVSQYGLLTAWDDQLSYMLQPALAAYEVERLTDNAFGNDDFQDAIKRHVPQGHCFKGFPTCFSHLQASRMLSALERGELSSDVLSTAGDSVRHALRIKIFPYAEDVCACWLMIATFYKGGDGLQQQQQQQQKKGPAR